MDEVTVVVIGGSGFLGQHVVHHLLEESLKKGESVSDEGSKGLSEGDKGREGGSGKGKGVSWVLKEVRVLDIRPYKPVLTPPAGATAKVTYLECDVRDLNQLTRCLTGAAAVVNCAAVSPEYQRDDLGCDQRMRDVNLQGARHVVEACRAAGVRALVHTSSVAVVVGGLKLLEHTETLTPVPPQGDLLLGDYARMRLAAEQLVLQAHGSPTHSGEKLQTVALRPPLLYGEGDQSFVPLLLRLARAGTNTLPAVGDPEAFLQAAYVGNVAVAHVCAVRKLLSGKDNSLQGCGGLPVYITDDTPPNNLPNLVQPFLNHLGLQPSPQLPYWLLSLLLLMVSLWTAFWSLLGMKGDSGSSWLPSLVLHRYAGTVTVVSRLRAELCLNYYPPYSWEQARGRAVHYYSQSLI